MERSSKNKVEIAKGTSRGIDKFDIQEIIRHMQENSHARPSEKDRFSLKKVTLRRRYGRRKVYLRTKTKLWRLTVSF